MDTLPLSLEFCVSNKFYCIVAAPTASPTPVIIGSSVLLHRWAIGQVSRRYKTWLWARWMCTPAAPQGGNPQALESENHWIGQGGGSSVEQCQEHTKVNNVPLYVMLAVIFQNKWSSISSVLRK